MSKLAEFREAERKLQEQLALLEKLKSDSSLKQELEFKDKLQALMDKYGMTLQHHRHPRPQGSGHRQRRSAAPCPRPEGLQEPEQR